MALHECVMWRERSGNVVCKREDMQARLKTRLSCPKGPPPDAAHMSSKLVDPEPQSRPVLDWYFGALGLGAQKITCSSRHPE